MRLGGRPLVGVALESGRVTAVRLHAARRRYVVEASESAPWPGPEGERERFLEPETLHAGLDQVSSTWEGLPRDTRVNATVPDPIVTVVPLTLEGPLPKKDGLNPLIQWHLKRYLPYDPAEARIAYQAMATPRHGETHLLTVSARTSAMDAVETALREVGLAVRCLHPSSFAVCNVFARRIPSEQTVALVTLFDHFFAVLVFREGRLDFYRAKWLTGDDTSLVYQVSTSLVYYARQRSDTRIVRGYLFAPGPPTDGRHDALADALGIDLERLDLAQFLEAEPAGASDPAVVDDAGVAIAAALGTA